MKNKALLLDRDGVINVEKNYVYKIEDFEFINGIFKLAQYFQNKGFFIIVITNQAGIGRGYYSDEDFQNLTEWMISQFKLNDINITDVLYSPFHPFYGVGEYKKDSECRKPRPGMIKKAEKKYELSLADSILIGDKETDIVAGKTAGVGLNILYGLDELNSADHVVSSLSEVTTLYDKLYL
jgi:D-glycero-D-manno-heptose 1,7-bisphosphate phosphatase